MKPGTVIKLKSGRTIKAVPNLVQILTQENSCVGCCLHTPSNCEALREVPVSGRDLACGSSDTRPIDEQVIFVEVTEDESG